VWKADPVKTLLLALITLAWDGVTEATSYKLYWGTSSGVYLYSQEGITATQYMVNISTPGRYFFVVTALNESGESGYSNEVNTTVTGAICDLNADGRTDVLDLQLLARAIVRAETTNAMDLNGDGQVNVLDLQRLSRVILGLQQCQ
jgi:hypothetical protein